MSLFVFAFRFFSSACACLLVAVSSLAAAPGTVEQWDVFEVALDGPAEGNPFREVELGATFTDGVRTVPVTGFYDGDGVYRVRFMPETTGEWRYLTKSNRAALNERAGSFTVTPARAGNHGPVRVRDTFHFAYADGMSFKPVGTTVYSWTHRPEVWEERTLKTLAASPFNKVRLLVFPQAHGIEKMPPPRWPFEGEPGRFDFTRFNPEFFRHLERRVGDLRALGIEADVILFHPYEGKTGWGFSAMDAETDDAYVRHVVARLAAYRNVWWSIANEYDYVRTKRDADWDRFFQIVQAVDPHAHLRSIHNGTLIYDHNRPWVTHASIQNGMATEDAGRATLYRDVWRRPVIYDELKYEGAHERRWARLSGPELVHRFWSCTVAGTYGGHSEFIPDENGAVWLGEGGELRGESAPRLAFLRKILEDGPDTGLNPSDHWQDPRMAGKPGDYYLIYFGAERPTTWAPKFFRIALVNGIEFEAEIIDAWDMTITSVAERVTVKKLDGYFYGDRDGREIPLPGKPYQAIRLRRVGGPEPVRATRPPVEP